jgi:hypothetical protein
MPEMRIGVQAVLSPWRQGQPGASGSEETTLGVHRAGARRHSGLGVRIRRPDDLRSQHLTQAPTLF